MEFLASLLGSAAGDTGQLVCASYPNIKNFMKFQKNRRALEKEMKSLLDLRNKVKEEVETSGDEMKLWLRGVEEIVLDVNSLQPGTKANNENLCGCFFDCRERYRLSRETATVLKEVERLQKAGNIAAQIVNVNYLAKPVEHIPGPSVENQKTASKNLAKVMDLLKDENIYRIGVWGMGGVGKTTLVKNLNNKFESTSPECCFGIVMWVTVSKELDLIRVQKEIAKRLHLEVEDGISMERLANRLHQRLQHVKKFLLIFDDVWETIDLDCLGVPQPEIHSGSKIIVISRSLEVCRMMKIEFEAAVKVDVLNDEEAWQLFKQNSGTVATLEHIEPLAKAVANECSGLPLAITIVGAAMRGKPMIELWKDALNELRRSVPNIRDIENKVYKPLKWSYDSLQGKKNIRPCFLYCSLYPEDFSIDVSELVKCWVGEGLIDEEQNYEDSYNSGIALIVNLIESCLLEHGAHAGTVKLHDVVRDVAIWISSSLEDGCSSLVRSGIGLTQILEAEIFESLKRVSFMTNKITGLPDLRSHCPEVLTLLLQGNALLERISDGFLQVFQSLRVLNIGGTHIQSLPESILQLVDLRVLLLGGCVFLEELPQLGALSKLQVLDCRSTLIRELPIGMKSLSNLRHLDLSFTWNLKFIQGGIISRLTCLEVLHMSLSAYIWGVKEEAEDHGQTTFEELGCLERLHDLSVGLKDIPSIGPDFTWIIRLRSYQFFIEPASLPGFAAVLGPLSGRSLVLRNIDLSREQIVWFLINTTSLYINSCWEVDKMFENLFKYKFHCLPALKSLSLCCVADSKPSSFTSCAQIGVQVVQLDLLPNLEVLCLHRVRHLKSISELSSHLGLRFSRLKTLEVTQCPQLDHVFSYGDSVINTEILEVVQIGFCRSLEEVFQCSPGTMGSPSSVVPNLRTVKLEDLPKLNTICNQEDSLRSLEQLEVFECMGLRKLPLTEQNTNTIKEIKGEELWWNNLVWDNDNTKLCLECCFTPNIHEMFHFDDWHWFRENRNWEEGIRDSTFP